MKKTSKHLTLEDRIVIERLLAHGFRFSEIATRLSKSRTTISREVKKNRTFKARNGNHCIHRKSCDLPTTCSQECHKRTRSCRVRCGDCNIHCERFQEDICPGITKAPYVCNACESMSRCWLHGYIYNARKAQDAYETTLKESRTGISLSEEQLQAMDELVTPLIQQGQSVNVVFQNHRDELPITARTAYDYIENGLLGAKNLDLARKVRRSYRRKSGPV